MMNVTNTVNKDVEKAVMNALKYYAIFNYPLSAEEVHGNCREYCSRTAVQEALDELVETRQVYKCGNYYSTQADIDRLTMRRQNGNFLALAEAPKARRVAAFIYTFPFVRFVGISGSLSKGYADNKSDYDFFIITDKNRLWICRTLLHVFKKLTFIVGLQHKFCMNYFIDTYDLEIEEKNQFTAVEMASLVPVKGEKLYGAFIEANKWVDDFFPNEYKRFAPAAPASESKHLLKGTAEFVLNLLVPQKTNKLLMRLTDIKWRKKWSRKNYPMEDYDLAFKTTLHVSKNHHRNHQKKVMSRLTGLK